MAEEAAVATTQGDPVPPAETPKPSKRQRKPQTRHPDWEAWRDRVLALEGELTQLLSVPSTHYNGTVEINMGRTHAMLGMAKHHVVRAKALVDAAKVVTHQPGVVRVEEQQAK